MGHGRVNAYEAVKEAIPLKITADITSDTTWNSFVLIENPNDPPAIVDRYVDAVALTIDAGAVVVIEEKVRLHAKNGGQITIKSGSTVCLEPDAEVIANDTKGYNVIADNDAGTIEYATIPQLKSFYF